MAFSLTDITPNPFPEDGGRELEVEGVFELENRYRVHIGGLGSTADPECYSGKRGQGTIIYPLDATRLRCYSPVLTPGGLYTVTVVNLDTAQEEQLVDEVTITERQFYTMVYTMRKILPNWWKTGPRDIGQEPL